MDMELHDIKQSDNNNELEERRDGVCPENGSCSNHNTPGEHSHLLSESPVADGNGEHCIVGNIPEHQPGQSPDKPVGNLGRLKRELNEQACWKLKVWMLLLITLILIIFVIFFSVYFCTVPGEDVDEKYDRAEFVVPRLFSGNLSTTLVNETFILHAQQKLSNIYTSSYALGRYFSQATVKEMSSSSVLYNLTFLMPEEHGQLTNYTLSKEMVFNVLLQELYDQEPDDPLYIEPTSLTMEVVS
ncbi:TPA-induced transmembrane protein [Clarias gariepinus]|uniref:TPA-induced transmembrane protein n=1 Tax=Clarias gariepinus TaxID=13013 RepID=UPI00234D40C0|nr:TPA-induced transmembrane protein [Clarias gariepinus]